MNKLTIVGIACWLASGLLLGFQGISGLMKTEGSEWENLSLVDMFGDGSFTWIADIPWEMGQSWLVYLTEMPTFILLLCVGLLFFIVNAFVKTVACGAGLCDVRQMAAGFTADMQYSRPFDARTEMLMIG